MRKKTLILILFTALLLAVSFLMPGLTLRFRDRALAESLEEVDAEQVQLSLLSELDPLQELMVLGDTASVSMPVAQGRSMDLDTAEKVAWEHLDHLCTLLRGRIGTEHPNYTSTGLTLTPELWVGSDGSGFILWTAAFYGDVQARIVFDDKQGALLGYSMTDLSDETSNEAAAAVESEKPSKYSDAAYTHFIYFSNIVLEPLGLFAEELDMDGSDTAFVWVYYNEYQPFRMSVCARTVGSEPSLYSYISVNI